ncbi:MAG: hypothetical protein M1822_009463 [Bathelium mastoideum]|nr:MAG: hypothetical protein M1822_009463 [Bathelium mastoideum]
MAFFAVSPSPRTAVLFSSVAAVTAASLYSVYSLYQAISKPLSSNLPQSIPSPRSTLLPKLSAQEIQDIPYPPDVLPGARDVDTPYGSIRVYEWGPENGRKVLLVHGISTPCISLAGVAKKLVDQGCRVMLFGGCIATHFTATFPHLVANLVLVAPAGLIREKHIGWQSRLLYSSYGGLLPERWVERVVAKRLQSGPTGATAVSPKKSSPNTPSTETAISSSSPAAPIAAEVANTAHTSTIHPSSAAHSAPPPASGSSFDNALLFPDRPTVSVAAAVAWQLAHHRGFLPAFISCIRHCPVYGQHGVWRAIGARLDAAREQQQQQQGAREEGTGSSDQQQGGGGGGAESDPGLEGGRVLVVVGRTDPIIVAEEVRADGVAAMGERNVEVVEVEAGHEVPITRSAEIVEAMGRLWRNGLGGD